MEWINFVQPELAILIGLLYAIGLFLKKFEAFTYEWTIPLVLWVAGIVITVLYLWLAAENPLTGQLVLSGFIQGTFIAAAAVFGNEVVKQVTVKRKED